MKARAAIKQMKEELSQFEEKNGIKLTTTLLEGFKANLCQIAQGYCFYYREIIEYIKCNF